jgi:hypothetical protein
MDNPSGSGDSEEPAGLAASPLSHANGNIVAQVVARRIESGLAFDDDSVRRAIENSGRPGYPLPGFFYTPEEEAALGNADPPERSG